MVCALTAVVVVGAAGCARAGVTNVISGGTLYTGIMQAASRCTKTR
jgi:predicted Rossmann-fold nucleotide-binding protein